MNVVDRIIEGIAGFALGLGTVAHIAGSASGAAEGFAFAAAMLAFVSLRIVRRRGGV